MGEARAKPLDVVPADSVEIATEMLTREQRRSRRARVVRSRTISVKRMTKRDLELGRRLFPEDTRAERPQTRGECEEVPRPCPFVSCKHHLFLDVTPGTGAIKLNFPDLEVWDLGHSCALDVADEGEQTLEYVGAIMNVTRERIRQYEVKAFARVAALRHAELLEHVEDGALRPVRVIPEEP